MNLTTKIIRVFRDTGERPIISTFFEEINNPTIKFAYEQILNLYKVKNLKILDYGCGGGYGTEFLSRNTTNPVTGYDIDNKTIKINKKFYKNSNIKFISDKKDLKKYDLIVCFQVIEHIEETDLSSFLKFLKKCLLPNGVIVFTTPNKNITSHKLKKPIMIFHYIEYTNDTLNILLKKSFKNVNIQGQISKSVLKTIKTKNYKNIKYALNTKITRFISQFEIVRIISRHLPMFFKRILMGKNNLIKETYTLVKNENEINNSFILIAFCKK